jgi:hypothetical protein
MSPLGSQDDQVERPRLLDLQPRGAAPVCCVRRRQPGHHALVVARDGLTGERLCGFERRPDDSRTTKRRRCRSASECAALGVVEEDGPVCVKDIEEKGVSGSDPLAIATALRLNLLIVI